MNDNNQSMDEICKFGIRRFPYRVYATTPCGRGRARQSAARALVTRRQFAVYTLVSLFSALTSHLFDFYTFNVLLNMFTWDSKRWLALRKRNMLEKEAVWVTRCMTRSALAPKSPVAQYLRISETNLETIFALSEKNSSLKS